jgi:hypothetical protein
MRDTVWICRDGRRLLVSEMSDSHLVNAINMILRNRRWRRRYLDRLLLETEIRKLGLKVHARHPD